MIIIGIIIIIILFHYNYYCRYFYRYYQYRYHHHEWFSSLSLHVNYIIYSNLQYHSTIVQLGIFCSNNATFITSVFNTNFTCNGKISKSINKYSDGKYAKLELHPVTRSSWHPVFLFVVGFFFPIFLGVNSKILFIDAFFIDAKSQWHTKKDIIFRS